MIRMLAVLALLVTGTVAEADDAKRRVKVALAIASAAKKECKCEVTGECTCGPKPCLCCVTPLELGEDAMARAERIGKPLVVWHGVKSLKCVNGAITCYTPQPDRVGRKHITVRVKLPSGWHQIGLPLPADSTRRQIEEKVMHAAEVRKTFLPAAPAPRPAGPKMRLNWSL